MPFLKPLRPTSITESRIKACKKNGLRHAIFTSNLSPKSRYVGEWKNDKKHGKGFYIDLARGFIYEGNWSNGKKHGHGELFKILPDKSRVKIYSGNWTNGKKNNFGRLFDLEKLEHYEGNFSMNVKFGFGRMWTADSFYQGTWKNDFFHGKGMFVLANGDRWEGHFSNGKKEGPGVYYHLTTGQMQAGHWLADKCIVSSIQDIHWRQSAIKPTAYPIPKNELPHFQTILEKSMLNVSGLCDPEITTFSAKYRDHTKDNHDCRQ